jgi:hypothetical protein
METNLVDLAKSNFTPGLLHSLSTFIGEDPAKTEQLIDDVVPTVFAGMAEQSKSAAGAARLFSMAQEGALHDGGELLSSLSDMSRANALDQQGQQVVQNVLGDDAEPISANIASHVGVTRSVVRKVLALVSPMLLATLGKQILTRGLSVAGLTNLLSGLGTRNGQTVVTPSTVAPRPERSGRTPIAWLPILLAGLLLFVGVLYGLSRAKVPKLAPAPVTGTIPVPRPGTSVIERLITGEELGNYLSLANPMVPKRFVYEGLNFATGSAELSGETPTLDRIASALKAHPTAEVRVEGYTDTVGSESANRVLAQQRADAVRDALIARGVPAERVSAVGYGEDRPVDNNATAEGRAQNRRTELVLVKR